MLACRSLAFPVARLLIQSGADVLARDAYGANCIDYIFSHPGSRDGKLSGTLRILSLPIPSHAHVCHVAVVLDHASDLLRVLLKLGGDEILPRASRHPMSLTSRAVASGFFQGLQLIRSLDLERGFNDKESTIFNGTFTFCFSRSSLS